MKEIKLNETSVLLREKVLEAKVEEKDLAFRNGLAISKAKVVMSGLFATPYIYECMGVINENFEEAFCISSRDALEKYVMFFPFNQEIIWAGSDSFRVAVKKNLGVREGYSYLEDMLLCLDRETNTLTSPNVSHFIPTKVEEIVIANKRLYSISKRAFLTHQLHRLQELRENIFYVEDRVMSQNNKSEKPIYDWLTYQIDSMGNVISPVHSMIASSQPLYDNISPLHCDEVYKLRAKELSSNASSFEEATRILKR